MEKKPARAIALLPIGVFLVLYLGLGIVFEYVLKIKMGFYNIPIVVAFLAAILVACLQNRALSFDEKLEVMAKGVGDKNIMTMILIFLAAGVILFSLFVGVVMLPILLQHLEVADHSQQQKEERIARAATAEVAIVAIQKMEERLAADSEENIDNQLLTEVSSRVIGNLRRRADGRNDVESSMQEENLERRFRLAALRSERAELYHLRATREISNETLQKLLHDLDLLEALLIEIRPTKPATAM